MQSASEIAIYAVETRAVIQILWGLLLVTAITLVSVSIVVVMQRLQLRSAKKRESQLARRIAGKAEDVLRLEERIAALAALEEGVEHLKGEVRRIDAIRTKAEQRLVKQNATVDRLRARLAAQDAELAHLRTLVEHVGEV